MKGQKYGAFKVIDLNGERNKEIDLDINIQICSVYI